MKSSIDNRIDEKNLFGGLIAKSVLNIVEEKLTENNFYQKKVISDKKMNIPYSSCEKKEPKMNYLELYVKGITGLIEKAYFND
jgi:hypothetical protein